MSLTIDHRQSIGPQIQEFLGVSNDEFSEIKKATSRLILTMLDVNCQGRNQQDKLLEVLDELRMLFPTVFDSTQNLGLGRQLVMQYLRDTRKRIRTRNRSCNTLRERGSQPSPPTTTPSVGTNSSQKRPTSTRIPHRHTPSHSNDPRHSGPTNQNSPPKEHESRDTGISEPSCPPFCPQPGPDRSMATATSSPCNSNPAHSISHIHRFLQNCSPPLDHLLSRFVDLGFHTQDILREVAHIWTAEERRALMTRLAPGPNGKRMTELELAALERGFQAVRSTAHQ